MARTRGIAELRVLIIMQKLSLNIFIIYIDNVATLFTNTQHKTHFLESMQCYYNIIMHPLIYGSTTIMITPLDKKY